MSLHADLSADFDQWKTTHNKRDPFAYYGPALRTIWVESARRLIHRLHEWDSLTEADAVTELQKGDQSIYHVLFAHDPRVWIDCPNDGRTPVTADGICPRCAYEVTN